MVMGAIIGVFWLVRPQDIIYALFSLQLFIWATHNLNLFVSDIPTSAHFWEAMTMSTLGWTVVAMIFFNHRYVGTQLMGRSGVFMERCAFIFAVFGMGIFVLPDIGQILKVGYGVWDSFLIVFGTYAIIFLVRNFWKKPGFDLFCMIVVEWEVTELPELPDLSPQRSLHIMRIVQEAVTNVIKHSGSDRVTVTTGLIARSIYIDLIDYGHDINCDDSKEACGRGIQNMKYRAEQIGGQLELKPLQPGTRLRLQLYDVV